MASKFPRRKFPTMEFCNSGGKFGEGGGVDTPR